MEVIKLGYIEKGTGEHQSNLVFGVWGVSPTLSASDYKMPIMVIVPALQSACGEPQCPYVLEIGDRK